MIKYVQVEENKKKMPWDVNVDFLLRILIKIKKGSCELSYWMRLSWR
jgi:hypothetical protein